MKIQVRTKFVRFAAVGVAVVLITSMSVVQGIWSDRWSRENPEAELFAERLKDVPLNFGDWEGVDTKVGPSGLKGAGAIGHISRVYKNSNTGEVVSLFIICGHSRDVSWHAPNQCYPRAGYEQHHERLRHTIRFAGGQDEEPRTAQFWRAEFEKATDQRIDKQRVFWAWNADGEWLAPEIPKTEFGNLRALYKMYFITHLPAVGDPKPAEMSASIGFGQEFLPLVTSALFPGQGRDTQDTAEESEL